MRGSKPTYEELEKRVRALEKEMKRGQQAREKAEKHEEFLQGIIDNIPVMIVCYDSQINILMLNREFTRCLGWTQEDAQKMDLMAACFPDPEYREMARKYMMEAVMGWRDFELTKKNGDILHSSWSNCRLSEGTQIGIGIDITQRKQAEEALRVIEYEKGLILDSMSEIVAYYSSTNLKIEWTNRAAGESVGLSPNKLVGEHCYEIWHNRNEPCDGCPVVKSFETGKPEEDERTTPDGREWYVRSYPVISEKGAIEGVVEVVQNITERKRTEEALRSEKDNLVNIFEAMEDGVYIVNQQYDIQYVNTSLEKEFGPYKGRKCYEYFHDRQEVCPWCKNEDVFAGKTVRWEWYSFKNDKTYDLIDTPLKNPDGSIYKLEIFRDITERKQAEEALRKERDKAQKYLDIAGVMFVALDSDGKVIMVNKKGCEILGYKFEEIIGKVWFDNFLPQSHTKEVKKTFKQLMSGEIEPVEYYENPVLTKSGKERIAAWHNTLLKDEAGKIIGTLSSGEDITERKQAEEALANEAIRRRVLIDQSRDGIVVLDQDGKVYEANQRYAEMLGYSAEEIRQLHVWDWDTQWTREQLLEMIRLVDAAGDHFETRHRRKDGTFFDVEVSTNGAVLGGRKLVFCVCRDISERKKAEEALRESEERYRHLFDNLFDAAFLADTETGIILEANTQAELLLGRSREEIIGMHQAELHPSDKIEKYRQIFADHVAAGYKADIDVEIVRKDGSTVPVSIGGHTLSLGGKKLIIGLFRDITERKRAEEQIKASLREKEVLLQEIHHRVKNNLQVISSLLNRKSKAIKYKKDAEVFRECQNFVGVMSIVHEKLHQNKDLASINFKDYIATVARELVRAYFPTKPDKVALKFELEDVSLGIDSAIPLGLVFNELITNSLKHAFPKSKKGEIRVSLHVRNEHEIELVVSDNGIGIPKDLDYRMDETYGLYLVAGLVEKQLQGKIKISGKPVVAGTEVKITFQNDNP